MRIVCLSAEAPDICFRLGVWDCVAGVSAFCPNHVPKKPIVFGFSTGHIDRILAIQPDLVITFSDVQARIARDLIAAGSPVLALNHHSFKGIADAIRLLGRLFKVTAAEWRLAKRFELDAANLHFSPARRAADLFRRMGQSHDFRYRLGKRINLLGWRLQCFRRLAVMQGFGSSRVAGTGNFCESRNYSCQLVWEER